jgi:hypothetical protein
VVGGKGQGVIMGEYVRMYLVGMVIGFIFSVMFMGGWVLGGVR